jgi:hypothetical protein
MFFYISDSTDSSMPLPTDPKALEEYLKTLPPEVIAGEPTATM